MLETVDLLLGVTKEVLKRKQRWVEAKRRYLKAHAWNNWLYNKFNKLQMPRKITPMRAATANKFVNKAEVISVKRERAKKHVLEVIDVRNNRTNS